MSCRRATSPICCQTPARCAHEFDEHARGALRSCGQYSAAKKPPPSAEARSYIPTPSGLRADHHSPPPIALSTWHRTGYSYAFDELLASELRRCPSNARVQPSSRTMPCVLAPRACRAKYHALKRRQKARSFPPRGLRKRQLKPRPRRPAARPRRETQISASRVNHAWMTIRLRAGCHRTKTSKLKVKKVQK